MKLTAQTLLTLSLLLCATSVTPVLTKNQDDDWKRRNDKGNRYEGLISIQTGNPDLEVLSFTCMLEEYGKEDVVLRVKFFSNAKGDLSVTAQEIETDRQYYMVAKRKNWQAGEWNVFGPWPTKDVIKKEDILSDNLGVLISGGGNQLQPAFVYHSQPPATANAYRMHLRSNKTFASAQVSLYGTPGRGQPNPKTWGLAKQVAGMTFRIDLDVSGYGKGPMRLVIKRRPEAGGAPPPEREYRFYHNPKVR